MQRHDGYVNDVQLFGAVIEIFKVRGRTKVRCDDEIAGEKRSGPFHGPSVVVRDRKADAAVCASRDDGPIPIAIELEVPGHRQMPPDGNARRSSVS